MQKKKALKKPKERMVRSNLWTLPKQKKKFEKIAKQASLNQSELFRAWIDGIEL